MTIKTVKKTGDEREKRASDGKRGGTTEVSPAICVGEKKKTPAEYRTQTTSGRVAGLDREKKKDNVEDPLNLGCKRVSFLSQRKHKRTNANTAVNTTKKKK
jgi:hypothetical protein